MTTVYHLRRMPDGLRGLNWRYLNRLVDGAGQTFFVGETPKDRFKKAVLF